MSVKALMLALALLVALPVPALATHMSYYHLTPVEHDDQGRVDEPDGASTTVLTNAANPLRNCVASPNLAAQCTPDAALPPKQFPGVQGDVIAPGCSGNDGRHLSGECGLHTVGVGHGAFGTIVPAGMDGGVEGQRGRTDGRSPGRLTPLQSTVVRFLDARANVQLSPPAGGVVYLDVDHKLQDRGVSAALQGVGGDLGGRLLAPGGTALWAMYGLFQDKNGNGVVDILGVDCEADACGPDGGVRAENEFVWIGRCLQFDGSAPPRGQGYCKPESVNLPVWVYPGDHHALCYGLFVGGAATCGSHMPYPNSYIDYPGRQAVCLVAVATSNPVTNPVVGFPIACPGSVGGMDGFDEDTGGDPILGPQDSVRRDGLLADRTGEAVTTGRQWVFGGGWASYFYDQSLLVSTVIVTAATPQNIEDGKLPMLYDPQLFQAVDVDRYTGWSPLAEDLLQDTVKPAARSQWVLVRAAADPYFQSRDALSGSRMFYDECDHGGPLNGTCLGTNTAGTLGPPSTRVFDAGFAHEPNTAQDLLPGAIRRACTAAQGGEQATFEGRCNDYTGYQQRFRAWADLGHSDAIYTNLAWKVPGGNCVLCVTSAPAPLPSLGAGRVRPEGNHDAALQPGSHVFGGVVGFWKDQRQYHDELTVDIPRTALNGTTQFNRHIYQVGPDGWVGDIVNNTGATRSRGFAPISCTVLGVTKVREFAECKPYMDGNRLNPQGYGGNEWCPAKLGVGGNDQEHWTVRLRPVGGAWTVPVYVWRHFDTWEMGDTAAIEDRTGSSADILMPAGLAAGITRDILVLPEGNAGLTVTAELSGLVVGNPKAAGCPSGLAEFVRDVDVYTPYGP